MLEQVRRHEAARMDDALHLELREEAKEPERALLGTSCVEDADRRLDVALHGAAWIDARSSFERTTLLAGRPFVVAGLVRCGRVRADEVTRAQVR